MVIELVAAVSGLACVWLTIRQNIWCWPVGLLMVALYAWIFFEARLYSDVLLQLVYIVLQIYGWHHWLKGGSRENQLPVTRLSAIGLVAWLAAAASGTVALGLGMSRLNASLPYWDAAITLLSLVAQFLLARKILESWLFWIAVDVLAIGVYGSKQLYLTAGLYTVFLGLAIAGWLAWHKSLRQSRAAAEAWSLASSSRQPAGTSS